MRTEDKSINTTDTMNAVRLVKHHGENIRYVAERKVSRLDGVGRDTMGHRHAGLHHRTGEGHGCSYLGRVTSSRCWSAGTAPHCTAGNLAQWAIESMDSGRLNSMVARPARAQIRR